MGKQETLYLKIPQNIVVKDRVVTLGDVAKMECTDQIVLRKLKLMKIYSFSEDGKKRKHQKQVMSVLQVLKLIHEQCPDLQVDNIGEIDFVMVYTPMEESAAVSWIKTIVLCVVIFFGAAFSIMAFNNDVGVNDLFDKLSRQVTGQEGTGSLILQIMYSIGLSVGILVFYNHAGRKKNANDPTPVQVEMRKYETDSDTAFIENSSREGSSVEVK